MSKGVNQTGLQSVAGAKLLHSTINQRGIVSMVRKNYETGTSYFPSQLGFMSKVMRDQFQTYGSWVLDTQLFTKSEVVFAFGLPSSSNQDWEWFNTFNY